MKHETAENKKINLGRNSTFNTFFLMPKAGNITTDYGKIRQGREISKAVASCISKEFITKYLSSSFFIVFEVTLSGTTKKKKKLKLFALIKLILKYH